MPNSSKEFPFTSLKDANLVLDATYKAGTAANAADDPIARLLPVGNQGGFRSYGVRRLPGCRIIVLYSTFAEPDWPDYLDVETGRLVYYGNNRRPGHELHDTPRGGNSLLRMCFDAVHAIPPRRAQTAPFFVFSRIATGRDVRFRGLAAPGAPEINAADDLVAIWKTAGDQRFQNYRAIFTLLDVPMVPRSWLADLAARQPQSAHAPSAWLEWVHTGKLRPLRAPRTLKYRPKAEQLPVTTEGLAVIARLHRHFAGRPTDFEACAVEFARMVAPSIIDCDLTRPWVDGGRDAVGQYRIGPAADSIKVEFALEAKCYALEHAVGVEDTSRLISRLRFRQFGVLVTTSWVHQQAYREIREDGHPVVILCARDLVDILAAKGIATSAQVAEWLDAKFPNKVPGPAALQ